MVSPTHADVLVIRALSFAIALDTKGRGMSLWAVSNFGFLRMPIYCPLLLFVWYSLSDWLSGMPNRWWSNSIFGFLFPHNLHSHIHTYAATHDCFLLEVFEGLVTPEQSELLKENKWTNYRGVCHLIGITTVALQIIWAQYLVTPPYTPFGSARFKAFPLRSLTCRGPCYIL